MLYCYTYWCVTNLVCTKIHYSILKYNSKNTSLNIDLDISKHIKTLKKKNPLINIIYRKYGNSLLKNKELYM